jgi:hydroxymethylbilane synthase
MTLRLGTRASALALAQSGVVASALTAATGHDVELVHITTIGDASSAPLEQIGGTGVFVSALREALLDGSVDLAVHSLKDLPTTPAAGLTLAAVPTREDPRDVLCARDGLTLGELPDGSTVGTGSPRRAAQLRALGLGLDVRPVRGNVDTRLSFIAPDAPADRRLDAVVLARAGLARLGRLNAITEVLDPLQMLPAPGQGALAVECREDRADVVAALASLDDAATRAAVVAERAVLATLEAGCTAPVGAYADVAEGDRGLEVYLRAVVVAVDGSATLRSSVTGPLPEAATLGHALAQELLADGAAALVGASGDLGRPQPGDSQEAVKKENVS